MKTFRINLLAILSLLVITACNNDVDEDFDTVAEIGDEAGMLIAVSATSNSSILGNPEPGVDLADAQVEITNAYLNMTVRLTAGSMEQVEKVEIVKSFNGGTEIVLGESTTLPYTLEVDNLEALLAGTGVVEEDLRIGDVLSFKTKVTQTDGGVYYYNVAMGNYSLTVNCSSNLAGAYHMNFTSGTTNITVTEVSPGVYQSDYLPTFVSVYWFEFTDTCGKLQITDWEYQGGNPISPLNQDVGYVDVDGNLVFNGITVDGVPWYVGLNFTILKD